MSTLYEFMAEHGYVGIQNSINSGPDNQVNTDVLNLALSYMFKTGWEEVDPSSILPYGFGGEDFLPKRTMIKYITNDNPEAGEKTVRTNDGQVKNMMYGAAKYKFRSGGWLLDIRVGQNGGSYILFKPHATMYPPISVQLDNIYRLFVKRTGGGSTKRRRYKQR